VQRLGEPSGRLYRLKPGHLLPTSSAITRAALQQVFCAGKLDSVLLETRQAAQSLCGGSAASRAILLMTKRFLSPSGQGAVPVLCEHLSPVDESGLQSQTEEFPPTMKCLNVAATLTDVLSAL
jgi:hypothetical protein